MLAPINISDGQVSGVSDLSSAASSVINWEVDESGANIPRPAIISYSVTGLRSAAVVGMEYWNRNIVVVTSDRYVAAIADAGPTVATVYSSATLTTQVGGALRPTFAGADGYIYVAGGGQICRWAPGLMVSQLGASPYCTHIAALGQRLIANDIQNPNQFKWSDIGEGAWTSWPAANFSTADARPDPIVALAENTSELFIWGTTTLQVYGLGSDPTLPYEVANTINVGLAAPYAYIRLDSEFAFLDDKRRIVISDGRSVNPISDPIQKDLRGLSTISDCWGYREERGQMSLLVWRFPTEKRTFVYDLKGQKWIGERKYYSAPFQGDFPVSAQVYWPAYNYNMFGSTSSSGGLYRLDDSTRSDLGGPLVCERTTGWLDFGSKNRKRSLRIRVVMKRGTAAENATPGALEVRRQADDGPWTPWQQVSVGTPSQYAQVQDLYIGGIFKRARYGFRYSTTEQTALAEAYDDVTDLGMP